LVGMPSLFIRLQGCNLRCPWCDQPEALEFKENYIPLEDLVSRLRNSQIRHVVITGGEPFTHRALPLLVEELLRDGFSVQIETNGTRWIEDMEPLGSLVHITVSPKAIVNFFVHPKVLEFAKELKFVVDEELTAEVILRRSFEPFLREGRVVLQPEGNKRCFLEKALSIQRELASVGFSLRVIPQMHKLLGLP